jgi:hypothetical protein
VPEYELERHARRRNVQMRGRLVQAADADADAD